ncbi:hypothetical protein [Bosea sp. ANAM02]|uniref:hypothetical protein n=1 Tax=Bosea sp. ANAM02 TaxID=2020412 RepID=UPI00140EDDA9|nr:hypothetical protein [Bosea sp. ANAM02]BCB22331.1 hypothetical protein OCUBac02_52250 [Bosea sp. ANAM02]
MADENEHALIIEIPSSSLSEADRVVADIASFEAELATALNGLGIVDGHDFGLTLGPEAGGGLTGASVYIYGQNADDMFAAVEPVLASNAMSAESTVRLRAGKPGTEERRVKIEGRTRSPGASL